MVYGLRVSPWPVAVGGIMRVTPFARNTGAGPVDIEVDPCVTTVEGLPPESYIFAHCAMAGPSGVTLAPGETWSRDDGVGLDIPAGRYSVRVSITLRPEVWLRLDFTLLEVARNGCRYARTLGPTAGWNTCRRW